jgi:hypothetical protein
LKLLIVIIATTMLLGSKGRAENVTYVSTRYGSTAYVATDLAKASIDIAECKMKALDHHPKFKGWVQGIVLGEYLTSCMEAKGYQMRWIESKQAYNRDLIEDGVYQSKEAEFLVVSGCYGDSEFNIVSPACWQRK